MDRVKACELVWERTGEGSPVEVPVVMMRLAVVTCAFYLAVAVLLFAATHILAYLLGGFGYHATRWGWTAFWGIVWLLSFVSAWRIVMTPMIGKIPK